MKGQGGQVLESDTGAWVPFTMRVDTKPFSDVRVRQAMRLICDRQQMIDQALSGYGSLGNDLYAPFDPAYAKDLPQREQDIDQAKSLLKAAGQEGLQVQLFTGDDIGSVAPATASLFVEQAKKAGVEVKVVKKNPFYGDDYLSYPFGQDFWNTRNYLPQAALPGLKSGTYNETHFDRPEVRGPDRRRATGDGRGQAHHAPAGRPGDRVQHGRLHHLGLPADCRWLLRQGLRHQAEPLRAARRLQLQSRLGLGLSHDRRRGSAPARSRRLRPPKSRHGAAAWATWLARRVGLALLTLWLVSVLVYVATTALGDPVRAILGREYGANPARVQQLTEQLNLDDSLVTRYLDWLGALLHGDLGTSLAGGVPVSELIGPNVVNTLCWCCSRPS